MYLWNSRAQEKRKAHKATGIPATTQDLTTATSGTTQENGDDDSESESDSEDDGIN